MNDDHDNALDDAEALRRYGTTDPEQIAADIHSRENTNEVMSVLAVLQIRRAFLAGIEWQKARYIDSEPIGFIGGPC